MKKISSLFKFFSLKPATMFALAVATILTLVLSACAPIPESERLPPLQPGYGRIIVNTGGVGSRAVTDADKKDARLDVSFNGVSYGHTLHATFKVGTDVRIVVKAYRNDASNEFIGYGTASHTMTYGTNQVTVDIYKVDGYYKVTYEYGDALLGGTYRGITADKNYYKGGEDKVSAPSDDDVTWQHGTLSGWKYNDGNGEQTVGTGQSWKFPMPSADITLTAQWTRNQYEIIYDMNSADSGGTPSTPAINTDTDIDALTSPQISATVPNPVTVGSTGYTFTGWLGSDGKTYQPEQTVAQITGNLTLKAQWTDKTVHTVTYNVGTGPQQNDVQDWKPSDTYIEGSATGITLPKLSAKGYTFTGWQDGAGLTVQSPYKPTQAVTLTARWTPITYTITYDANGGGTNPADTTFTIVDGSVTLADRTGLLVQGSGFAGWTTTGGKDVSNMSAAELIEEIASGETLALRAKWTVLSTLYVSASGSDSNSGESTNPLTINKAFELAASGTKTIELQSSITNVAITQTGGTITLKLNGYTLTGDSTNPVITISGGSLTLEDSGTGKITGGSRGVKVDAGAAFTMNSGEISGNISNENGAGVYINENATFSMNNGTISNNTAKNGGGVYVDLRGSFTMTDGIISSNTATNYSGGVTTHSVFIMEGGEIKENKAVNAGGVYVAMSGTFTMSDGTISNNTADQQYSGVYLEGTYTMNGGTISNHSAYGVYISSGLYNGTFNGDGSGTFTNNSPQDYYGTYSGTQTDNSNSWTHN